jgi:hypothetical protein
MLLGNLYRRDYPSRLVEQVEASKSIQEFDQLMISISLGNNAFACISWVKRTTPMEMRIFSGAKPLRKGGQLWTD